MPKFWHKFLFCQSDKKVYIDNDKPPEVKEDTKFAKQLSFAIKKSFEDHLNTIQSNLHNNK